MENKFCPFCHVILEIRNDKTYKYDPIVCVDVVAYFCPECGHEEEIEYLRQI